jgi:hypothetical protein
MNRLPIFILLALALITTSVAQAAKDPLPAAKKNYEKLIQNDLADRIDARSKILQDYSNSLNTALEKKQKAGDLDAVMALKAERKRFDASKGLPPADAKNPAPLAPLVKSSRESLTNAQRTANQRTLRSAQLYIQHLEKLKTALTQKGDFDNALAMREEIALVNASPIVIEAQEALKKLTPNKVKSRQVVTTTPEKRAPAKPKGRPCGDCLGTGKAHKDCIKCKGAGTCLRCRGTGVNPLALTLRSRRCLSCRATGICRTCNGKKRISASKTIKCATCQK